MNAKLELRNPILSAVEQEVLERILSIKLEDLDRKLPAGDMALYFLPERGDEVGTSVDSLAQKDCIRPDRGYFRWIEVTPLGLFWSPTFCKSARAMAGALLRYFQGRIEAEQIRFVGFTWPELVEAGVVSGALDFPMFSAVAWTLGLVNTGARKVREEQLSSASWRINEQERRELRAISSVEELVHRAQERWEAENKASTEVPSQPRERPAVEKALGMTMSEDAGRVVQGLAEFERQPNDPRRGHYNLPGDSLSKLTGLAPDRLNDIVTVLENRGLVKADRALGTNPYSFSGVELTPAARLDYEMWGDRATAGKSKRQDGKHRVFIGHGRAFAWRDLKDFLKERLGLDVLEFNHEPAAGYTTAGRLEEMLNQATFAFLLMTAEDVTADGTTRARENVVHEVGLFQGKLGFKKAIVLFEEGCNEFSNIVGLTQIRFPKGDVGARFEEIRRVLEREGVLPGK